MNAILWFHTDAADGIIQLADHAHNFVLTLSNISTVLIVKNRQTRENTSKILSFILSQKYRQNPFGYVICFTFNI